MGVALILDRFVVTRERARKAEAVLFGQRADGESQPLLAGNHSAEMIAREDSSARARQRDLVQEPLEPFAGEARRLVEPFARVDIVMLDRQHHELLRFASPCIEFLVAFDRADIVVARTD